MKPNQLSDHRLSALCSSVLSNPLYFSYFLFFSPYLLTLVGFLSPLFATTALLAGISGHLHLRRSSDGEGDEDGEELKWVEEFDVFAIVFGPKGEYPDGEFSDYGRFNPDEFSGEKTEEKVLGVLVSDDGEFPAKCDEFCGEKTGEKVLGVLVSDDGDFPVKCDEIPGEKTEEKVLGVLASDDGEFPAKCGEFSGKITEEKVLGVLFSGDGDFPAKCDEFPGEKTEERVLGVQVSDDGKIPVKFDKISGEKTEEKVLEALLSGDGEIPAKCDEFSGERMESKPSSINGGNQGQQKPQIKANSRSRVESQWNINNGINPTKKHDDHAKPAITSTFSDLGSSERKEREWRRTLACMLFEERHGSGAGEGMDKLWEAYEKTEHKNGGIVVDDDDDDDEGGNVELCCMQALKMSAGKVNFGMGKFGVLKISKVVKGIGGGWLGRRRHQVHHHHHGGGDGKKGSKF